MSMRRPLPTHQIATQELDDLLRHIFGALEAGILFARGFFDETDEKEDGERPYDPYLFAMLVRYRAKVVLDGEGKNADNDMDLDALPLIGLKVAHGGYIVRIRLALDLRLPVPGQSAELQRFYQQLPCVIPLPMDLDGLEQPTPEVEAPIRVVFLWRALPPTFRLEANLACPRDAGADRGSISEWWNEPLKHPSLMTTVAVDATNGEREDLPTETTEPKRVEEEGR